MVTPALTGIERFEQYKNYYQHVMSVIAQAELSDKRPRISVSIGRDRRRIYFSHNGFRETFDIENFGTNFILIPFDEGTDYAHGHYCIDTRFRHVITEGQHYSLMKRLEKLRKHN